MSVTRVLFGLLVCGATMRSITSSALNSPCPELFHYDSLDEAGKWTGTVTLLSDADLYGLWLRLIFDGKVAELDVSKNFGPELTVVPSANNQEFLIKNREFLVKTATPAYVKITVKYEGDKAPRLIGYRLNAKMVCSVDNINSYLPFTSDFNNEEFLASVTPHANRYREIDGCGTTPLKNVQYPWQAAIYHESNKKETYVCEGTLFTTRHILTPAHCVSYQKTEIPVSVKNLRIYFGKFKGGEVHKYNVQRVDLHPGYLANGLLNDLAVVLLDAPVIVNDYIRPICLGDLGRKNGVLVGYGINGEGRNDDLGQAKVEIIEDCEQEDLWRLLSDNMMCAKYAEGNKNCVGTSGSSLVALRSGSKAVWELKGIVTVGVALQNKYVCDRSSVVLIIDVPRYWKWILAVIS